MAKWKDGTNYKNARASKFFKLFKSVVRYRMIFTFFKYNTKMQNVNHLYLLLYVLLGDFVFYTDN